MSQFKFHNDMNNILNLDGELKTQSKPRWQRKIETSTNGSINASKLSVSYNNSYISAIGGNTTSAGNKTPNKSSLEAGCSKKKTPNDKKSSGSKINAKRSSDEFKNLFAFPGRKTPTQGSKTPSGATGGDRFIPNRGAMNFELGHYLVGFIER